MIKIDDQSITPKYLQISNAILDDISSGIYLKDQQIPSINELSSSLEIARDTVEKAYKHLKQIGVIASIPGKGFFVFNDNLKERFRVILIFNKLSAHKK